MQYDPNVKTSIIPLVSFFLLSQIASIIQDPVIIKNGSIEWLCSAKPGAELIQAKVPILKFRDARYGLQVDLNCNNVVGIKNTSLLQSFSRSNRL